MAPKALPSQEVLRQLLRYEPGTGKLFWLPRPRQMFATARAFGLWNTRFAGKEAFDMTEAGGHHVGKIFGERYKAHRIIWMLVTGSDPQGVLDHKNGDPTDNRFENLRVATSRQNATNRKSRAGASSRFLGVQWHGRTGKWVAAISTDGRPAHIGLFESEEEAARAYDAAARKHHGEFARPNFAE